VTRDPLSGHCEPRPHKEERPSAFARFEKNAAKEWRSRAVVSVYCLFCKTGREADVAAALARAGFRAFGSEVVVNNPRPGRVMLHERRVLLPGYVFLESAAEPDWKAMRASADPRAADIIRVLSYGDGSMALRGRDLEFASFLRLHGGLIGLSRAAREGTRVRVIDGPLKRYEGSIVRVNSRRQSAEVRIDEAGIVRTIWLGYELVEPV